MNRGKTKKSRTRWKTSPIFLLVFIIIAVVFALAILLNADNPPDLEGKQAPAFNEVDVDGTLYRLEDSIGRRPILIAFIYTDSHWCKEVTTNMREVYEDVSWGELVEFLSVSSDGRDSVQEVWDFRNDLHANWTFIKVHSSVGSSYQVDITPTIFIIDEQGIIREIEAGYQTVEELKDMLEPYI